MVLMMVAVVVAMVEEDEEAEEGEGEEALVWPGWCSLLLYVYFRISCPINA